MLGKQAPELIFEKILNFEKDAAKLSDFKGQLVILDFWAVWCGPCLQSFPHLEALQSAFPEDIHILTITQDPEARIQRFLDQREMGLPIVIDAQGALARQFPHGVIPHTVVIDKSGTVRVIARPSELTEALIRKLLAGQEVRVEEKRDVRSFDPSIPLSGNDNLAYQITISPYNPHFPTYSNATGGLGPYAGRRILATNLSARALFEIAYQFPPRTRTVVEVADLATFGWSTQQAICLDIIVPEELGARRFDIMQQQLDLYFAYEVLVEERVMPVKVLQRIEGAEISVPESAVGTAPYANDTRSGLSLKAARMEQLAGFLENRLHQAVVDETGLDGWYDIELPWYHENPAQVHEELKKLGLEIVDAQSSIDVLVIRDRDR